MIGSMWRRCGRSSVCLGSKAVRWFCLQVLAVRFHPSRILLVGRWFLIGAVRCCWAVRFGARLWRLLGSVCWGLLLCSSGSCNCRGGGWWWFCLLSGGDSCIEWLGSFMNCGELPDRGANSRRAPIIIASRCFADRWWAELSHPDRLCIVCGVTSLAKWGWAFWSQRLWLLLEHVR